MEVRHPLAVDLDGTLCKSDSSIDALISVGLRSPKYIPKLWSALLRGRASLKSALSEIGAYRPESAPLRDDFVSYLREQKASGRELHLVTASPQPVADAIAERVGLFDSASGSFNDRNLKGDEKARHLQERFPEGFSYAGNDRADLKVWRHARSAIAVAAPPAIERRLSRLGVPVEQRFPAPKVKLGTYLRMLRSHQWSKNVLMFFPLVLAHQYTDPEAILRVTLGFLCMCLVASATYIANDLSDLDADRQHATKSRRPLAAGEVSVTSALLIALALGLAGMVGALALDKWFALALLVYAALTVSYSIRLKEIALLDVFVLGLLYTLRIVMGTVLIGGLGSPWLLVFSLFFFFSLSMAKRQVEIVRARQRGDHGRIRGRGYEVTDEPLTLSLGIAANSVAVLLLFLYVANDAYPQNSYSSPQWLWAISPIVFLWSTRIWLKSHRGKLDDDPINFALRDGPSLLLGVLVAACFVMAVW